jgi:hypothetical protein
MRNAIAGLALAAAMFATPALAQSAAPPAACPAELGAWSTKVSARAAATTGNVSKAQLVVGKAVTATLLDTPKVKFPLRPEQPGGSVSHGGLFNLTIAEAGTYRIALSGRPWIDVVRDGKGLESSAHGGAGGCTGIVKLVDFPLTAGTYLIQISGSGDAQLGVLVAKKP